jgi:hypothetical protein
LIDATFSNFSAIICIHGAIFALTHLPEATGTSKTEFGQVKIMKEFA